jgi:prevent-host-death family protein
MIQSDYMDVGVRELKKRLSEYLERAARGEVIRVTDRGVPKATLGPLPGRLCLDEGIAAGWIRAPSREPPSVARRHRGATATSDTIGEDRGT